MLVNLLLPIGFDYDAAMKNALNFLFWLCFALASSTFLGCGSASDILTIIDDPDRKSIDTSIMGVNAFFNDQNFGTIPEQFGDIKNSLRLSYVRALAAWDDNVQPTPESVPNFAFYDDIAAAVPSGVQVMFVLTGIPSWMSDPANWIDNNPRKTFVELWVKKVAQRYAGNGRIRALQIWNEQNDIANPNNAIMEVLTPSGYLELLQLGFAAVKSVAPGTLVISGATTAINQNYPESLQFNRDLRDSGAEDFMDLWGVHYYGKQFENVVRNGGIEDFFNGVSRGVWITESGAQGINSQLAYAEQVWPFLTEKIPAIERIFYYQYSDGTAPPESTYAMRTLDSGFPVSDLYVFLRDR